MRGPVPSRLAVYRALCALSPEGYAPLARMILSTANAEAQLSKTPVIRNVGKPVITLDHDDREGA